MATLPNIDPIIYSKLAGAAGVTAITTRIYAIQAPPSATFPYVTYEETSGIIPNLQERQDLNTVYRVHSWTTAGSQAANLHLAVFEALHRQVLTISGWHNWWMACEQSQRFTEQLDGKTYWHFVWDVRIRASKDSL